MLGSVAHYWVLDKFLLCHWDYPAGIAFEKIRYFFFSKSNDAELIQYRWPCGFGTVIEEMSQMGITPAAQDARFGYRNRCGPFSSQRYPLKSGAQ